MKTNPESSLFHDLSELIEQGRQQAVVQVNSVLTLTYWHVGTKINDYVLRNKRADYAKEVIASLGR